MRRSTWAVVSGLTPLALGMSACTRTANEPVATLDPSQSSAAVAPPTGQDQLAQFYSQKLTWESCTTEYARASCAWLTVPLDYANPGGQTIKLRMLKVTSTKGGTPSRGVLFVNPGSLGWPRSNSQPTLALLCVNGRSIKAKLVEL